MKTNCVKTKYLTSPLVILENPTKNETRNQNQRLSLYTIPLFDLGLYFDVHVTQVVHVTHQAEIAVFDQPGAEFVVHGTVRRQFRPHYLQIYDKNRRMVRIWL